MGGISNYYHGETAELVDCWWQPLGTRLGDDLALQVELADNPHRSVARDYGSDIGIDPGVAPGDKLVYLRLDDTCGIWVRDSASYGTALTDAIARVLDNRRWMQRWKEARTVDEILKIAQELNEASGSIMRIGPGEPPFTPPSAPLHVFLSYSSANTLLARQLYDDLSRDAQVKVWFDLAQPAGAAPTHDEEVAAWLQRSVRDTRAFALLLTKEALRSDWVSREIEFATQMREARADFRILVVKAEDVPVPEVASAVGTIIDCDGIWWSGGVSEELFAAVYGRQSRKAWIAAEQGAVLAREGVVLRYGDLATEAGIVERFDWGISLHEGSDFRRRNVQWSLAYRRAGGEIGKVSGAGEREPADLGMRPGDRIAFMTLHRHCGSSFQDGRPLWMRSGDLKLTPDEVLDRYYEALEINRQFSPIDTRVTFGRPDTWKRVVSNLEVQSCDGEWHHYPDVLWAMLRKGVAAEELAEQILLRTQRSP